MNSLPLISTDADLILAFSSSLVCQTCDCLSATWNLMFAQYLIQQKVILSGWGDGEQKSGGNGRNGLDLSKCRSPRHTWRACRIIPVISRLYSPFVEVCQEDVRHMYKGRVVDDAGQLCMLGKVEAWGMQVMGFRFRWLIVYLRVLVFIAVNSTFRFTLYRKEHLRRFKLSSASTHTIVALCLEVNES